MKPPVSRRHTWSRAAALAVGLALTSPPEAGASEPVDLELLLAVDVSPSVDAREYALQIGGLAQALRHPDVIDAIQAAAPNGIAIALMLWAGPEEQALSVPWSKVRDEATAEAFAGQVELVARPFTDGGTAIGDALARSIALLAENGFHGPRQVIDISGDGKTNLGNSPAPERARAIALGITVNGLVILNEEKFVNVYYQYRVIGGPGAFVLPIQSFEDFALAFRLKLIREILVSARADAP